MTTPKPTLISRKKTRSENFDRADPIVVHESRQKVVKFIPKAVHHNTSGWRMRGDITQYDPRKEGDEGVRIVLSEDDVEALMEGIRRAAEVMTKDGQGAYVVTPVPTGGPVTGASIQALVAAVANDTTSLEALATEGGLEKLDEMVSHLGRLAALNHAVEELEQALQRSEAAESFYQTWCARNSWAFGMSHLDADAIRKISREDQVDLLMPRLFGGYRDLVELKTPTVKVLEKVRDFYHLSKPASEALGQALHYASVLQRHAPTYSGLQGARYIVAHRPKAIVVIGSSGDWNDEMKEAWHIHNCSFSDVQLWTFEELLECGRRTISVLSGKPAN